MPPLTPWLSGYNLLSSIMELNWHGFACFSKHRQQYKARRVSSWIQCSVGVRFCDEKVSIWNCLSRNVLRYLPLTCKTNPLVTYKRLNKVMHTIYLLYLLHLFVYLVLHDHTSYLGISLLLILTVLVAMSFNSILETEKNHAPPNKTENNAENTLIYGTIKGLSGGV